MDRSFDNIPDNSEKSGLVAESINQVSAKAIHIIADMALPAAFGARPEVSGFSSGTDLWTLANDPLQAQAAQIATDFGVEKMKHPAELA